MPNKTDIAKTIATFVVGSGTAKVVKEIIKNNTDPDKSIDKVAVFIASMVLAAIAADASKGWTDAKIDSLIDFWTKNVTDKFGK